MPRAGVEDGEDHREAPAVPADDRAARLAGRGGGDERLDLARGSAACPRCRRRPPSPGAGSPLGEEQRGGVRDLGQALAGHLEDADLVGRAEAVLDRAQDAELVAALALEVEHGVDHVLDHARAGDLALLGDVADQDHRDAAALGEGGELVRAGADLGDRARRALDVVDPHGLDRVDDGELRRLGLERGQDVAQVGFGGELARGSRSRPRRWARIRTWPADSSPET